MEETINEPMNSETKARLKNFAEALAFLKNELILSNEFSPATANEIIVAMVREGGYSF